MGSLSPYHLKDIFIFIFFLFLPSYFCAYRAFVTSRNRFLPFGIPNTQSASKILRDVLFKLVFVHIRRLSPLDVDFYAFGIPIDESTSKFSSDSYLFSFAHIVRLSPLDVDFYAFGIPSTQSLAKILRAI